jgi:hypothetical protein
MKSKKNNLNKKSISDFMKNKISLREKIRKRNLQKWHTHREKQLLNFKLVEKDKFCKNCIKHLGEQIKLVEDERKMTYCPVCYRVVHEPDEMLYNSRRQEIMKKIDSNLKSGHRMMEESTKWRLELIQILGNSKCIRCGFSDIRALQLDHIRGDGAKDRKRFKNIQYMWYYYLDNIKAAKKNLQVLCANCNWIKRSESDESSWHNKRKNGTLEIQKNLKKYNVGLKKYKTKLESK